MSHPQPTAPAEIVFSEGTGGRMYATRDDRRLGWTGSMPGAEPTAAWIAIWRDPATKHLTTADASTAAEAAAALRAGLQIGA